MPYRSFDSYDEDIKKLERKVKAHERRWRLVTMSFSVRDLFSGVKNLFVRFYHSAAMLPISLVLVTGAAGAVIVAPVVLDQHRKEDCMVSCVDHHWRYNAHTRNACICAVNNHELTVIKDKE